MRVTEVRIRLVDDPSNRRIRGFASIVIDGGLLLRDLRILDGDGGMFVSMPSRKLTDHCPACRNKNVLAARFCSACGVRLATDRAAADRRGHPKLHADVAHPINGECRRAIESAVVAAYREELALAAEPGYRDRYSFADREDAAAVGRGWAKH